MKFVQNGPSKVGSVHVALAGEDYSDEGEKKM
jgi:hypothetical protein